MEGPSLDGFETLLVLSASETMTIELGAALVLSSTASFLDLFEESFLGAISCEDKHLES